MGSRTASVLQVTREPGPWGSVTGTHRESREESTVLQVLITPPSSSPHPPRVSILLPFSDPQVPLQASSKVVQSPEGGSL